MIALDEQSSTFIVDTRNVPLTGMEFRVLKALSGKAGSMVTRSELQHALYIGRNTIAESNVLEVLVSRLRRKLTSHNAQVSIKTIRGQGYKLFGEVQ